MKIIDIATREYRKTTTLDIINKDSTSFELIGYEPNVDIEVDVALRTIFKLEWVTTVIPTLEEYFIGNKNKLEGMISFLKKVGYKFLKTQSHGIGTSFSSSVYREAIELCNLDNPQGFTMTKLMLDYLRMSHSKAKDKRIQKELGFALRELGFGKKQKHINGRNIKLWFI